jgi:uncharacterized protein (TIGR04206 family)
MAWVRSEYAGELAVVSVWLTALLPWSVSFTRFAPEVSRVVVRFHPFQFQFLFGADLGGLERPFLTVVSAREFPADPLVVEAYTVWLVAAAVFAVAFGLSVVYYVLEERLESGPVDPVRVLGGLLVLTGSLLTWSTWRLWTNFAGTTIPVGVLFCYVLGGVLLVVERTEPEGDVDG